MHLPAELARAVEEQAGAFSLAELARAAAAISERYRSDRPRTGHLSAAECAAWAVVRMPATWAAACTVLEELRHRDAEARPRSVLDLGAGPGGGIHAAGQVFSCVERATAIEREAALIALGEAFGVFPTRWIRRDLRTGPGFEEHDLVLLGWVVGELDPAERESLIERAWHAAGSSLIIIEPGTPRGFQIIRSARDRLLALGANLVAPCPSADACGAPEGEWCHFAARIERSALHRRLKGGELSYEDEKFSYLIASRRPASRAEARVVRHPRHEPRLIRLELCTGTEWRALAVSKRQKEQFRLARKAEWGGEWRLT